MYDYMEALYHRFDQPTKQILHLKEEADRFHRQLSNRLEKPEKKLLLKLVDLHGSLYEHGCVNSFVSGYRVSRGIHQELLVDQPPYNFEREDEANAIKRIRQERGDPASK